MKWRAVVLSVMFAGVLSACSDADEPRSILADRRVVWSEDRTIRPLAPIEGMTDDVVIEAEVLGELDGRVVVVGDEVSGGTRSRMAYLIEPAEQVEATGRPRALAGNINGVGLTIGEHGDWLAATFDPAATSMRVFTSAGQRSVPTFLDPVSGVGVGFAVAEGGETLHGIHALDDDGRVLAVAPG
jgi:hypothetical protein